MSSPEPLYCKIRRGSREEFRFELFIRDNPYYIDYEWEGDTKSGTFEYT
ncbi:MAG: hypothetical protein IIW54_07615 [Lachnospiraceae bacterium]|nr:hypothetical protein [Lachnospiraceae bacterium]